MNLAKIIKELELKLDEIIKTEGYQEKADGFNEALQIIKKYHNKKPADKTNKTNKTNKAKKRPSGVGKFAKVVDHINSQTNAQRLETLIAAGIITKTHKLAAKYRQPKKT